jgi:aryl-alcohol dehydrogenase-like predicted oxidoreductase
MNTTSPHSLNVARLGFGAMRLPARSWSGPAVPRETALAVLRRTAELGVDHIDTAAFYFFGDIRANELIRASLYPYPEKLVIATKVGPNRHSDGALAGESGPGELPAAVEQNLRELGRDSLDLVYLRVGGIEGPTGDSIVERFEVLAGLRERGLIRHLGLSNVNAEQVREALRVAPVAAVQNYFNVLRREDNEVLTLCEERGIAFVPFFPLGGHSLVSAETLDRVAARHDASAAQIALAWLLDLSPVTLAIPGTSSIAHLEENMAAADLVLSDEDRKELAGV